MSKRTEQVAKLRSQTATDLLSRSQEIRQELFLARNQVALEKTNKKPHLQRVLRKERARILTILHQQAAV